MFRRAALSVVAPLALAALAACGSNTTASTSGDAATTVVAAASDTAGKAPTSSVGGDVGTTGPAGAGTATADVPEALQFSAPLIGGGEIDLREYAGRTVALWFWAPT